VKMRLKTDWNVATLDMSKLGDIVYNTEEDT